MFEVVRSLRLVATPAAGHDREIRDGADMLATIDASRGEREAECRVGDRRYRIVHAGWRGPDDLIDEQGSVVARLGYTFLGRGTLEIPGRGRLEWRRRLPLTRLLRAPDGSVIVRATRRLTIRRELDLAVDEAALGADAPERIATLALLCQSLVRRERAGSG